MLLPYLTLPIIANSMAKNRASFFGFNTYLFPPKEENISTTLWPFLIYKFITNYKRKPYCNVFFLCNKSLFHFKALFSLFIFFGSPLTTMLYINASMIN